MKREFLKRFTMLALIVTVALAMAVVSANAQPTAAKVVANVPFEFSVGYKTLPAGEYSVQSIASAGNGLLIQSSNGKISALRLSEATRRIKDKPKARLVFHRYGERYFLAEVWNGVDNSGRQLLKSQEESGIASELMLASSRDNAHAPGAIYETVEVLAVLR
ncbi:MAG: hypothetical protein ACRD9S_04055 [Pyrinomonadaceae bacterium]